MEKSEKSQTHLNHIAIVLDGNRRYAKAKSLPAWKGHYEGADKVEEVLKWCKELGIKEVTIYALSTENLKREPDELKHLFDLFKKWFKKFKKSKEIKEDKMKIRFIGDLSLVPADIKELALEMEKATKDYNNYILNFCFAYDGRNELISAFNKLKNKKNGIKEEDITKALWLSSEPQLIIRTGGKTRTSNFLPWQAVYSEWQFIDTLWPAFTKQEFIECINKFKTTERNFGK